MSVLSLNRVQQRLMLLGDNGDSLHYVGLVLEHGSLVGIHIEIVRS